MIERFNEICPLQKVSDMSLKDLISDCNVAFKIIGYEPKNLEDTVRRVYLDEDIEYFSTFAYLVWRHDNES